MITLRARVEGGRLVLNEPIDLPDGTEVEFAPVVDDDLDEAQRAALDAALERSASELARRRLVDATSVLDRLAVRR